MASGETENFKHTAFINTELLHVRRLLPQAYASSRTSRTQLRQDILGWASQVIHSKVVCTELLQVLDVQTPRLPTSYDTSLLEEFCREYIAPLVVAVRKDVCQALRPLYLPLLRACDEYPHIRDAIICNMQPCSILLSLYLGQHSQLAKQLYTELLTAFHAAQVTTADEIKDFLYADISRVLMVYSSSVVCGLKCSLSEFYTLMTDEGLSH
jgi:hypothetical protein